jgi:putative peptidoglycan lipid II flippase
LTSFAAAPGSEPETPLDPSIETPEPQEESSADGGEPPSPADGSQPSSPRRFLVRAGLIVAVATLFSRVSGFVREMVIAAFFGTGLAAGAFRGANQIPNLLRLLLGEAAIGAALIPVFTSYLAQGEKKEANKVASGAINSLMLLLAAVIAVCMLFAPLLVQLMLPGYTGSEFWLTVGLTRVMFPSVLLMALSGMVMGILNAHDRFTAAAIAPVVMNIVWIGMTVLFAHSWGAFAPAYGFLIGSFVQFGVQLPALRRTGYRYDLGLHLDHPGVQRIWILIGPMVLSLATQDINSIIDTRFASLVTGISGQHLGPQSVAAFGYAVRLWIFPISIFAISVATVLFPTMSRHVGLEDFEGFRKRIGQGMRVILLLLVPSTIGLMVLAVPIVRLVFQRGLFTNMSTLYTASALTYYTIGLTSAGLLHITNRAFYSLKDTRTPLIVASVSIVTNWFLDWFLMWAIPAFTTRVLHLPPANYLTYALGGIALSTSLVSVTSFFALNELLRRRIRGVEGKRFAVSAAKITASSAVLGAVAFAVWYATARLLGGPAAVHVIPVDHAANVPPLLHQMVSVGAGIAAGLGAYIAMVWLLRVEETRLAADMIRRKFSRRPEPELDPER